MIGFISKNHKLFYLFILVSVLYTLYPIPASAVCPICTVAVGAGLGISRALGIDDAVTSVWIGGIILSSSFWLIDWLGKKKFRKLEEFNKPKIKQYYNLTIIALMYLFVLIPLWYGKFIGRALNTLWGIDKILFGTAVGTIAFLFGMWMDKKVRKIKGKQLFIYQKVVFPVSALLVSSLILDFIITKYYL